MMAVNSYLPLYIDIGLIGMLSSSSEYDIVTGLVIGLTTIAAAAAVLVMFCTIHW